MSYVHNNKNPVILKNDPIDPGDTDWIYFSYENWLRNGETITLHSATVDGGLLVTDSTYLGNMEDTEGITHSEVYGVQFTAGNEIGELVTIKHRKLTQTSGDVDLGRNIEHSAVLTVKML